MASDAALLKRIARWRRKAIHAKTHKERAAAKRVVERARHEFRSKTYHRRARYRNAYLTTAALWLLDECREHGWQGNVNGVMTVGRTWRMQSILYARFRAGAGAPAFSPNSPWPARHLLRNVSKRRGWPLGCAVAFDVSDPVGFINAAAKVGVHLHRPYLPREPWHVESVRPFAVPRAWPV